jgi:hypothetical protein
MPAPKRQTRDAYLDDDPANPFDRDGVLKDGRSARVPMQLADHALALRDVVHQQHPPATGRFAYKRGYLTDIGSHRIVDARETISDPVTQGGWPTANSGLYTYWGNTVGQPCRCPDGSEGRLVPHPNQSSLICEPLSKDAATVLDATAVWYQERARLSDEWKRYGPKRDSCCSSCADQEGTIGYLNSNQMQWPTGQHAGQECMTDRKERGHIVNGRCVADRRDGTTVINPGQQAAVGDPCGPDGTGRMVKRNGKLQCEPVEDFDHQTVRDRAYAESVRAAENAWKQR